jgi:hypothetical protein
VSDIYVNAPTVVDDSGTGRDGTVGDLSWYQQLLDAINIECLSATNPLVTPAATIDEVVTARGTKADLSTFLLVEHNADGTHNIPAGTYATVTQLLGGIGGVNLVQNDDDLLWPDGDALPPDGYAKAGAGAAVLRCGTGLGDTSRKIGDFCARLTRAGADCTLTRDILTGAAFTRADFVKGLYAAGGAEVKCSTANAARVGISDVAGVAYSSYHTGGGDWEWLPVTRQINAGATGLSLFLQIANTNCNAYWSGRTLFLIDSNLLLPRYVPCPTTYGGTIHFAVGGVIVAGTNVGRFQPARSGLIKDVQMHLRTCPTAAAIPVDVNTNDDLAVPPNFTSIFSGGVGPSIGVGVYMAGKQPDGTYARRCIRQTSGGTIGGLSGQVSLDIDNVGAEVTAADLGVEIRLMQYESPLERFQTV